MAVAVIPYDGKDPLKYLLRTAHAIHTMGIDVVIVDTKFTLYPPYVKRIKQRTPGIGGARYDGFTWALSQGYDCIINADSHLMFRGNLHDLCKTKTWSGTYHHPWIERPIPLTIPTKIYASYVTYQDGKIWWCSVIDHHPKHPLPMTSEPLYAVRRNVLEQIVEWWRTLTSYGLDNIGLLFAPPGELITTTYYYHLGILDRGKPAKRKPTDKDAQLFVTKVWPSAEQKVLKFHEAIPPGSKICWQMWP
jgi:glycosyltransferase involved in cell wall biosynthesis